MELQPNCLTAQAGRYRLIVHAQSTEMVISHALLTDMVISHALLTDTVMSHAQPTDVVISENAIASASQASQPIWLSHTLS